jgi:hypothetical protein
MMDVREAPLRTLVRQHEHDLATASELRRRFVRHTQRMTRRYPEAYFELGRKTDEAVEALADRTYVVCARVEKGRFPFQGRTPFVCFIEEDFEDSPIRYHAFFAKLSVARELLRDDYAANIRRDPVLRWRDELHRSVGRVLADKAVPVDAGPGGHRRWTVPGLRPVLREEEVVRRLSGITETDEAVMRALQLLGQPIAHSRLSNLLARVLPQPATAEVEVAAEDHAELRRTVLDAWSELGEAERALVAALARGDSYDTLIARVPEFTNRVAVSRAVKRVSEHFVNRIAVAMGIDPDVSETPKTLMEHVLLVLWPILSHAEET